MKIRSFSKRVMIVFISVLILISGCTVALALTKPFSPESNIAVYSDNNDTDRFIIKYNDENWKKDADKIKEKADIIKNIENRKIDVIKTKTRMKTQDLLSYLKDKEADSNIEYIQPDYEMTVASDDTLYEEQWGIFNKDSGIPDVNTLPADVKLREFILDDARSMGLPPIRIDADVPGAWDRSLGGNVIVAVLDTGIDISHEDLSANIWSNTSEIPDNGIDDDGNGYIDDTYGWNFCDDSNQIYSNNEWHGTHIAGIIGAVKDNGKGITGVAPTVKIMPLKVFKNGSAYTSDILNAIDYAQKMGAKIANSSWGATSYNQALKDAIEESELVFVCAAGNSHMNIDENPVYPASFDLPNIITVASIGTNGALSGFSNFGGISVDVAAPGEDIISTLPSDSYGKSSGTSMATAFVSGEAALLSSLNENISASELKNQIIASSDKLSSLTGKTASGGKINCSNAVTNVSSNEIIQINAVDYNDTISNNQGNDYTLFAADSWSNKADMPTARRSFGLAESGGMIYAVGGSNGNYLNTNEQYDPVANTWTTKAAMPTARDYLSVAAAYGKVYAIGGYNGSYLNTVEEYDPATNTWTIKASMPTARQDAGVAAVNGKIYIIGGYNGGYLDTVEEYNPLTNTWTTKAAMPTARAELGAQAVNGKIYTMGGYNGSYLNTVQEYNPSTDTWSVQRSMPASRKAFGISVVNNKIYPIGGYNGSEYLNSVEEYNPALDTWLIKTGMTTPRAYTASASYNGCIYTAGGYNGSYLNTVQGYVPATDVWVTKANTLTTRGFCGTAAADGRIYAAGGTCVGNSATQYVAIKTFEEYNPDTNTWSAKTDMPTARFGAGAATVDGKVYVIGGWDWQNPSWELKTVEMYDPQTNTWTSKADMLYSRYAGAVTELNGKIYAIGGYSYRNALEEYNPQTNTWTQKANMPTSRYSLAAASANGKIYAIGGYNGSNLLSTVEEYDPAANTWTTKASMPIARNYLGAVTINGKIFAIGGQGGNYLSRVDVYDPVTDTWSAMPGMSVGRMRLGTAAVNGKIYAIGGYNSSYLNVVEEYAAEFDKYVIQSHFGEDGTNPATGNFSRMYTDMSITSPGFEVNISRTYNSKDDRVGPLGRGWTFGFEGSAKDDAANSSVKVVTLPNGAVQTFTKNADESYTARDSRSMLVKNADNTHTLTTKDQYKYIFNTNGWLTLMQDRYGNSVTIEVDTAGKVLTITDIAGRYFAVDYAGTSYIRYVREYDGGVATGRATEYQYSDGRLVKAINPMGQAVNYYYDSSGYMNEVKDNNLNRIDYIVYNHSEGPDQHKVSQTSDAFGNTYTYAYDNANRETSITDSNGRQTVQYYDSYMYISNSKDAEGKLTIVEYNVDLGGINRFGEKKSITDRNGNKTTYYRDSMGNITKIENPDLSAKEYTYDNNNNMTSEKDESGKYIFYVYDAEMKYLLKKAQPLNGTDLYYSGVNEALFAITAYTYYTDAERQQLGYLAKGLLKSVTDPEGGIKTYTYDSDGNIVTETNPETNNITTYEYNNIGWKTAAVTPQQYRNDYVYDSNGRLERTTLNHPTDPTKNSITRITYDEMGRKTKVVLPNLYNSALDNIAAHTYTGDHGYRYAYYPDGKVNTETDTENNTTTYTYDLYGKILTETKPNLSVFRYEYDMMNRLKKTFFKDDAGSPETLLEEYSYTILADGKTQKTYTKYLDSTETAVTVYTYDFAGRLAGQVNPDNTSISTVYNSNGTVYSETDANGNTKYYRYNGFNLLSEQWLPLESSGGNTLYTYIKFEYDKSGRKITEKIGKEKVALYSLPSTFITKTYVYYKNGNVKTVTDSAGGRTEYRYDADGILNGEDVYTDAAIYNTTEYINNYMGKPSQKKVHVRAGDIYGNDINNNTDTILTTSYTYDKNGNLGTVTTPDSITTTYTYDNLNRQLSVSQPGQDENGSPVTIITSQTYNWQGQVLTKTDANGRITTYSYDKRGFLEKISDAKSGVAAYYYDRAGRKTAEVSPQNYDPAKTLAQMNRTEYTYDKMDRVKTITETYTDPVTSQWVSYVSKAYKYDNNGNVLKKLDALGYESGTGSTADEKINSGYGTQYTYNMADLAVTLKDPVSQERGMAFTTKYDYDASGRKVSETNAIGVIINYYYNDAGNVTSIKVKITAIDPEQTIQSITYDLSGNVLSKTDGNGNNITYEYNAWNKVRKENHPYDETIPLNTITRQYDVMGNAKLQQDSMNTVDLYTYDNQGRVLSYVQKKSDGTQAISNSYKYDRNGNKRYETDGNNNTIESTYDELNRLTSSKITVSGILQTAQYGYDKNGNLTTQTDWRGNIWTNVYDPLNRLIEKRDPYTTVQKLEYNHNNAQGKSYDALNKLTEFTYDKNNRLLSTIDPELYVTSQTYDNAGNVETKKDGKNNTTTYSYDEFNRLKSVLNAKNETTSYTYDLADNMLTQTDGKDNTTTFEYNVENKLKKRIDPGGTGNPAKTESYTYYADGTLATKLDRNGVTTTFIYDSHDRMLSQTAGTLTISYTYDGNGNQLTISDNTGTTTRTYDELNRVLTKSVPDIGTTTFVYDIITGVPAGSVAETSTDPKGNVTQKTYDKAGRLAEVTTDGQTTAYIYYANGNRESVTYPNQYKEVYTYYGDNLVWTLTNKKADGSTMDSYIYTYDAAHNQLSKTETINGVNKGTTSYAYDNLNRLETVTEPGGKLTSYTYDAAGNRLTESITVNSITTVTTYAYNNQNRLISTETPKADGTIDRNIYYYDNNGNMTYSSKEIIEPVGPEAEVFEAYIAGNYADSELVINEYNEFNLLKLTLTGDKTVTYAYNGEGLRTEKTVNGVVSRYLYEYDKVVLEVDGTGTQTARNVYGTNLLSRTTGGQTLWYMYNGHADVTALIDATGTVQASYYYDAFGNITEETGTVNNPIRYAGYMYDSETGLYYLNARYYNSKIARFLSEDTYRGQANDPLSLNLYTYALNNPIMYIDPTGHTVIKQGAKGDGVVAIQEMLNKLGYNVGAADGSFGPKTKAAVLQYQKDNGLQADGIIGNQTLTTLKTNVAVQNAPTQVQQTAMASAVKAEVGGIQDNTILMSTATFENTLDQISTLQQTTGGTVNTTVVNNQVVITGVTASKPTAVVTPVVSKSTTSVNTQAAPVTPVIDVPAAVVNAPAAPMTGNSTSASASSSSVSQGTGGSANNSGGLWQFNINPAQNADNMIGTMSSSTETLAEGLNSSVSSAMRNQSRPNNIQPRVWNNQVESEIAEFGSKTSKLAKGAKVAGYAGIGVGVGVGIYDNIQAGVPTNKIVSDAAVDTAFGVGGIAACTGAGALYGSIVPGAGNLAGAVVGFVGGVGYMVVTEIWEPNGKSIKDRAKEGIYNSIK